jgi:membrane-associated phospholipid phosphatase
MALLALGFLLPPVALAQPAAATPGRPLWTSQESLLTGSLLVGSTTLLLIGDENLRDEFQKNRHGGLDRLADGLDVLGHPLTLLGVGGGLWSWGRWREDQALAETGQLAVTAILGAQAVTFGIKIASGRQRPGNTFDADTFRPFAPGGGHDSLPSAHTSSAFALAAVLARRCEHPWVPWLSYGGAGLVGISRLYRDDHWASDVVLGALVGELSGRLTLRWHNRGIRAAQVVPVTGGGLLQLVWTW